MAIDKNDPLAPEPPKPSIPFKKTTLVMLVILMAGLVAASSLIFGGKKSKAPVTVVEQAKEMPEPRVVGKPANLESEEEDARERAQKQLEAEEAAAKALAKNNPQSPLPAQVRRTDDSAAVIGGAAKSVDARNGVPAGPGYSGPTNGIRPDFESREDPALARAQFEQQVRSAPSMVLDESGSAFGGMVKTAAPAQQQTYGSGSAIADLPRLPDGAGTPAGAQLRPEMQAALQAAMKGTQTADQSAKSWLSSYAKESNEQGQGKNLKSYRSAAPYVLHQGKVIPVVLGRKINSDLPGEITAVVSSDVYDSLGGGNLLIPKGSQLVGAYDSEIKVGQSRLLFAFKRLIMPNGVSFDLPAAQGSDLAGAAGVSGKVNNHFFKMFTSSFLIAWLGDKTTTPSTVTNIGGGGVSSAAGQVLVDVSKSILERNRTIQPTITIDQGTRMNVQVVSDMVFEGPYRR